MDHLETLERLHAGDISLDEAHHMITPKVKRPPGLKRARYAKMRIKLNKEESRFARILLRVLFALPLPMFLVRFGLNIAIKRMPSNAKDEIEQAMGDVEMLKTYIKYSRGTTITIQSDDADIKIKIR